MALFLPGKYIYLAHPHTGSSAMTIAVASAHPDVIDLRPHHMTLDEVHGKGAVETYMNILRGRERVWDLRAHVLQRIKQTIARNQKRGKEPSSLLLPEQVRAQMTGQETVFSVVRNPYDFLVSCYLRQGKGENFESFVTSFQKSPFVVEGKLWYHAPSSHHVLKWESLQDELDVLMASLGCPRVDMGKQHNITQDKQTWESYYTPKAYEVVNRRFGDEIQRYYPLRNGSEKP